MLNVYIPHQAYILTNRDLDEFNAEKILFAYDKRRKQKLETNVWELEVHPTDICMFKCGSCSYASRRFSNNINYDALIKFVKYCSSSDLKTIFFSGGGDPSNWRNWEFFFKDFPERKWKVGVATNLYNLSNMVSILDEIDFFQIHVVGYDNENVKESIGIDSFETLDNNLNFLFKNAKSNQRITLKILVNNKNSHLLKKMLSYVSKFNSDTIIIKLAQNFMECQKNDMELFQIRDEILNHSICKKYRHLVDNLDDEIINISLPKKCYMARSGLYALVRADGNVFPCIASSNNNVNSLFNISDDYFSNKLLSKSKEYYDNIMNEHKCPIYACRHYRFNCIIDDFYKNVKKNKCLTNYEPELL